MTKKKVIYWIIGILLALVVLMAGFHFWNKNQSSDNASIPNSSVSSGSGNNNHNPGDMIQKHLKQMGL